MSTSVTMMIDRLEELVQKVVSAAADLRSRGDDMMEAGADPIRGSRPPAPDRLRTIADEMERASRAIGEVRSAVDDLEQFDFGDLRSAYDEALSEVSAASSGGGIG